jgi:hypothetical protein
MGNNIKMHVKEIGWKDVEWTHLAQDRGQWRDLIKTIKNLRAPKKAENFLTS